MSRGNHRLQTCRQKKSSRVKRRHWCHSKNSIGLDSLFQKTPMFTQKKTEPLSHDALENPVFERWFENVKGHREVALHLFAKQIAPIDS